MSSHEGDTASPRGRPQPTDLTNMSPIVALAQGATIRITAAQRAASSHPSAAASAQAAPELPSTPARASPSPRREAPAEPMQEEDPEALPGHGRLSRLHRAVLLGHAELVRDLVAGGASVNAPIMFGGHFLTLLHLIGSSPELPNGTKVLAEVMRAKANLNARSSFGSTPLSRACYHKHSEAAALLLEAGADVQPADDSGLTALHCAVSLEVARKSDSGDSTPDLDDAKAVSGELVSSLLSKGFHLKAEGPPNAPSPLLSAVRHCNRPAVTLLLAGGARPASVCLHAAVDAAPVGIIEDLLKAKANPFEHDEEGKAVLDVAFRRGDEEVTSLLRDHIGELERRHLAGDAGPDCPRPNFSEADGNVNIFSLVVNDEDGDGEMTLGLSEPAEGNSSRKARQPPATSKEVVSSPLFPMRRWSIKRKVDGAVEEKSPLQPVRKIFKEALAAMQPACRRINRSQTFQTISLIALLSVLFLPDVWIIFDFRTNDGLDWILVGILFVFLTELFVQCVGHPSTYVLSFFFWMDVLGLLSLPLDHSLVQESMPATLDNTVVARAARTARLGARAGRFMKLVKLLRFLPSVQQDPSQLGQPVGTAKYMSDAVTASVSTRVSCLIIVMVMILPLFEMTTYPENDNSMKAWANSLDFILERYGGGEVLKRLSDFVVFYIDKDYYPVEVYWKNSSGYEDNTRLQGSRPMRLKNEITVEADSGMVWVLFNFGAQNRVDALCHVVLVIVIIMLMMGFSLLLSHSVSNIVLEPLEDLLRGVKGMASKIFKSVNNLATSAGAPGADPVPRPSVQDNGLTETELLEKVIEKLAALSAISMKPAPVDSATLELLGQAQGEQSAPPLEASAPLTSWSHDSRSTENSQHSEMWGGGQSQDEVAEELVTRIELALGEADIPWSTVDSWEFDVLELTDAQKRLACTSLLVFHLGQAYSDSLDQRVQSFVEAASLVYQPESKVPYHNFNHAADVTHAVFRLLVTCSTERVCSNQERFALMVAAMGHDLGHPGFNNPFLVETSHELAIMYNDHSPLENMHCAKLFEIIGRQVCAVFNGLDRQQHRDARQVCVDAILHTDNVHHFSMVKELQMLYEINCDVLDVSMQMHQTAPADFPPREWVDILSEPEKRKILRAVMLHFGDISNPTKSFPICSKWAKLVVDEFFQQGDREKELGITVQPLNDRDKVNFPQSQIGFIEFFVAPFAFATLRLLPPLVPCTDQMMHNIHSWCEEWCTTTVPVPSQAEQTKLQERVARLEAKFVMRDGF